MPLNNRRTAYLREKAQLSLADVKTKLREQGITKEQFYEALHIAELLKKTNKKTATQEARKIRRNPKYLLQHLTQLVEEQPRKRERMVQVSFRVFREIDEQSIRHDETRKNGKTLVPHEYIEDDGFYMGETDIIKMTLPWKYIHDDVRKVTVDIMLNRSRVRSRAAIQEASEFLASQENGINTNAVQRIKAVQEHYSIILVIEGYEEVSSSRNPLPNPRQLRLLEQDTRMSSKFLKYEINTKAKTLYDLFKADKYYRPKSCLANAIMNLVADRYNSIYKANSQRAKPRCTYEYLWKLAFPNEVYDESQFPMSFDEARPIFKYFRIRAEQRHSNGSIEAQYHPNDDGIKCDSKLAGLGLTLVYLRKDNHAFAVTDSDIKTSLTLKSIVADQTELKVSTHFPIPSGKSILVGGIRSIEELTAKIIELQLNNTEPVVAQIVWCSPVNLKDILECMVIECNYHPNITTKAGCQINSLSFGVGNVYVILSRPNFGVETMITNDLTHMDVEECLRYQELKEKTMKEFYKPYLKSHYSEGFLEALREYKRGALHGRFRNGFNLGDKVVGLDTIKCYLPGNCS